MHSKWMDVGMDIAAFHLQSSKYDGRRPPAFGEHPELTCLERERERNEPTMSDLEERIDDILANNNNIENPDFEGGHSGAMDKPAMSLRHKFQTALRSRRMSKRSNNNKSNNKQSKRAMGGDNDGDDNCTSNRPTVRFQSRHQDDHLSSNNTLPATGGWKPLQAPPPMPAASGRRCLQWFPSSSGRQCRMETIASTSSHASGVGATDHQSTFRRYLWKLLWQHFHRARSESLSQSHTLGSVPGADGSE